MSNIGGNKHTQGSDYFCIVEPNPLEKQTALASDLQFSQTNILKKKNKHCSKCWPYLDTHATRLFVSLHSHF